MEKRELLSAIQSAAASKLVSREEVLSAFESGPTQGGVAQETYEVMEEIRHISIAEVFYYIGGAIVVIGIAIFIGQNWTTLSPLTKTVSTLGSAIVAFIVGYLLMRDPRFERPAHAFYLIYGLTAPIGLYVLFDVLGYNVEKLGTQSIVAAILVAASTATLYYLKRDLFLLFIILYSTWLYFVLTSFLAQGSALDDSFFQYRILLAGVAWATLGYYMTQIKKPFFSGFLYGFGSAAFLGSALLLAETQEDSAMTTILWESIFPGLVVGVLYLSTLLKSRSFLVFSALFLMIYIFRITAKYFSGNIGWPLSLVIVGLCLIGVGYLTVYLNNRYITKKA